MLFLMVMHRLRLVGDDTDKAAATQTTYINTNGQDKTGTVQQAFKDLTGGDLQSPRWMNTIAGEAAVSLGTKNKNLGIFH